MVNVGMSLSYRKTMSLDKCLQTIARLTADRYRYMAVVLDKHTIRLDKLHL